jgi:hypothetical protein
VVTVRSEEVRVVVGAVGPEERGVQVHVGVALTLGDVADQLVHPLGEGDGGVAGVHAVGVGGDPAVEEDVPITGDADGGGAVGAQPVQRGQDGVQVRGEPGERGGRAPEVIGAAAGVVAQRVE